jgi:hypothetical protein
MESAGLEHISDLQVNRNNRQSFRKFGVAQMTRFLHDSSKARQFIDAHKICIQEVLGHVAEMSLHRDLPKQEEGNGNKHAGIDAIVGQDRGKVAR